MVQTFDNELGNKIYLKILREKDENYNYVRVVMTGPNSDVDHTYTEFEAINLFIALKKVLENADI